MNILGTYWVFYYLCYVLGVGVFLWLYRWDLSSGDDPIYLLAAGFGVSAGAASVFAILVEVIGRTMLLIPAAVKKLKEAAHQEGRQQGRTEEREKWIAWLRRRDEAQTNDIPFDEPMPSDS